MSGTVLACAPAGKTSPPGGCRAFAMASLKPLMSYLAAHPSEEAREAVADQAFGKLEPPHGYESGQLAGLKMTQDLFELNQRVVEAKDASGKVELLFVEERAERRQAVNDIWEKLKEIQNDVRFPTGTAKASGAGAVQQQDRETLMSGSVELSRIEKELASHRAQMQELRYLIEGTEAQMRTAQSSGAAGSPQLDAAVLGEAGRSGTKELEKKHRALEAEVGTLRDLWMEVQLGLSMCSIRASRISIRTVELSDKGRKQALTVLEAKEEALLEQIDRVRKDHGLSETAETMLIDPLDGVAADRRPESEEVRLPSGASPKLGGSREVSSAE